MTYIPLEKDLNNNALTAFGDSMNLDAFGNLRVSQGNQLFDSKFLFDKRPLFWDEVETGSGETSTHSTTEAHVAMTTSGNNQYVIRQTKQRFTYQAGFSHVCDFTFSDFHAESNIIKRVGYFSSATTGNYDTDFDGLFFENDGTNISINIYKTGTEIESTNQSSWNIDKLDGTGESGITIDWEKAQIAIIDFQWLGVGRVRWAVNIDGVVIPIHESKHANNVDGVYMSSPNQPLRYEIRQTGAGSGSFNQICSTVKTEGSISRTGAVYSDNAGVNDLQLNSSGTTYAMGGIRLKTTHPDVSINLLKTSILLETNDDLLWEWRLNPTVTGSFTYNDVTNACTQTAFGNDGAGAAPTVSGGTIVDSGYLRRNTSIDIKLDTSIGIGTEIDGTVDELVLCGTPITNGSDAYCSFTWEEF